jgi:hypothetical protein
MFQGGGFRKIMFNGLGRWGAIYSGPEGVLTFPPNNLECTLIAPMFLTFPLNAISSHN